MGEEPRKARRRDLLGLLGRTLADAAAEARRGLIEGAAEAGAGGRVSGRPSVPATAPANEVPLERGALVLDLARTPLPLTRGRRFRPAGLKGTVLVVRVTPEHVAAIDADCPRCGKALRFDTPSDSVVCNGCGIAFRMDGEPRDGSDGPRPNTYPCRVAGPRVEVVVLDEDTATDHM